MTSILEGQTLQNKAETPIKTAGSLGFSTAGWDTFLGGCPPDIVMIPRKTVENKKGSGPSK